jgi:hypothetical protein
MKLLIPFVVVALLWLLGVGFVGWLLWTLVTALVSWLGRH